MTDVQTTTAAETLASEAPTSEAQQSCSCAHSTRRNVLLGAGAAGATALLAACGTSTSNNTIGTGFSDNPAPAGSAGADANDPGKKAGANGQAAAIVKTSAVPVGSGIITTDYVITQPTAGTFKAFSKVCPHQGCDVNKVDGGVISCPCHGSQFAIADGSVKQGPAVSGLKEQNVKVSGGNIVAA